MITVYAFGKVVAPVHGITRDLRVLWALEETGLPYRVHTLEGLRSELRGADYLAVNPFGTVPAIDDDGFRLFESAAIVLYLADKAGRLLPADREVATAKYWAAAGGQRVVHAAQHLHGGMGVDRDYPLHRYFLLAKQLELFLGGANRQLLRLGAILAEEGPVRG